MTKPHGTQRPEDAGSQASAVTALIRRVLSTISTSKLVQVQAVTPSGTGIGTGTVDVLPMIMQQNGIAQVVPHSTVFGLSYFRIQGGTNAVILDPEPGDIGLAICADRDTTKAKATRAPAAPDSFRMFSISDGVYLGGLLNGEPAQTVYFVPNNGGIVLTTPGTVTINASAAKVNCPVTAPDFILSGSGYTLAKHEHGGVQPGGGETGPPNANG